MNQKTTTEQRIKAMLKYLPCRASGVPKNLRSLRDAEMEGLANYDETSGIWRLTSKGEVFMGGSLKAPKRMTRSC